MCHSGDRKNKKNKTADMLLGKASKEKNAVEVFKLQCCALCGPRNYTGCPDLMLVLEKEGSRASFS